MAEHKTLGAVLFEDFELLDLYGPLEVFGNVGPELKIVTIAERARNIAVMTEYEWQADPNEDPFAQYLDTGDMTEYLRVLGKGSFCKGGTQCQNR